MSKKKGVSAEEKRTRMLQLFYEKKEFFQLKELEKIAPKEKGIIAQSVKDVVQSLVDDGLVDTDKIGTSIYFWAYPSKGKLAKEKMINDTAKNIAEKKSTLEKMKNLLDEAKVDKEESEERTKILEEVTKLTNRQKELMIEIQKYKDCDPAIIEDMKRETEKAKEAANRWTDNIFAVKSWSKNKFSIDGDVIDKQFGIPPDLDYL